MQSGTQPICSSSRAVLLELTTPDSVSGRSKSRIPGAESILSACLRETRAWNSDRSDDFHKKTVSIAPRCEKSNDHLAVRRFKG